MHKLLACGTKKSLHGCEVKVRFIYLALREAKPEEVFAQLITGFESTKYNPDILGVDLVMPEDGNFSLRDYKLHMAMINFLHKRYPKVRISLHAGELTPAFAPAKDLRFHIRAAIETADAERIGHGVDIKYETAYKQLLSEMAKKHIMVEINLTSNAQLLDVQGKDHPLPLYIKYGVPVSLSTDDEGILRTNITEEYAKAEKDFGFSYKTLKSFARNSISYSFLPGKNLWSYLNTYKPVADCANDPLGEKKPSEACQAFLAQNEKARQQWQLESNFRDFEQRFVK